MKSDERGDYKKWAIMEGEIYGKRDCERMRKKKQGHKWIEKTKWLDAMTATGCNLFYVSDINE